ncbi:MAG TPA: PLDc_N domain-containing protein [Actinobacteria bacterium]|nr:PLDc_N domain-containing protein [Actinomycetota bacterium]
MEIIFGLFGMLFFLLMFILPFLMMAVSALLFALWVWMLIDVVQRKDDDFPEPGPNTKMTWILVVILAGLIGAPIYYFVVKKKMDKLHTLAQDTGTKPQADSKQTT